MSKNNKISIGLGTGRSGTQSLATFLGIPHQGKTYNWAGDEEIDFNFLIENGGDVGSYYLNYVYKITEYFGAENVSFVCVIRNKQETINSFLKKFKDNHLDIFNGELLPKINAAHFSEKVDKYYDMYVARALELEKALPNFKIFSLADLNSQDKVKEFVGQRSYGNPHIIRGYCKLFS